jgi:septum formation protein
VLVSSSYIYLASRSLRRRELLHQIQVDHEVLLLRVNPPRARDVDEDPAPGESPRDYVKRICRAKAEAGWNRVMERKLPRKAILAADTTVCLGERIFGSPASADEAKATLKELSGKEHQVLTAVAVKYEDNLDLAVSQSAVKFRDIAENELDCYVRSGEPLDKAGAYAVQGRAAVFISEIRGSYSGVMGLPLFETASMLKKFGVT